MLKVDNSNSFLGRSDNVLRDALVAIKQSSIDKKQEELNKYNSLNNQGNKIKRKYNDDLDVVEFVNAMKAQYLLPQIKQRKAFIAECKSGIQEIYSDFDNK